MTNNQKLNEAEKLLAELKAGTRPECECESALIIFGDDGRPKCSTCGGLISEARAMAAMPAPGLIPDKPDPLDALLQGL
jgi:hypothetical protein